jgi:hypothetical protein
MRYYATVPYEEKEAAKGAGGRWDPKVKLWYFPEPPGAGLLHHGRWSHYRPKGLCDGIDGRCYHSFPGGGCGYCQIHRVLLPSSSRRPLPKWVDVPGWYAAHHRILLDRAGAALEERIAETQRGYCALCKGRLHAIGSARVGSSRYATGDWDERRLHVKCATAIRDVGLRYPSNAGTAHQYMPDGMVDPAPYILAWNLIQPDLPAPPCYYVSDPAVFPDHLYA